MKSKKYRFSCPLCGWLSWENKLNNHHDLEVVEIRSGGRGKIENIFLKWGSVKSLSRKFKSHFYKVLRYLLRKEYINAEVVKNIVSDFEIPFLKPLYKYVPPYMSRPNYMYKPKMV